MGTTKPGVQLPPAETPEVDVVDANNTDNQTVDEQQNDSTRTTKVNGVEFPAEFVNKMKVTIKGTSYKVSDDEDTSDSYIWQTKEKCWGSYRDNESAPWEIVKNSSSFVASSYGVDATIDADMLFKHILPEIAKDAKTLSPTDFESKHKHQYDGLVFSIVQIHVPAHTDYISPYTTVSKPKPHRYDTDYVFTYIEKIQMDADNINHMEMLTKTFNEHFSISPKSFVRHLMKGDYFTEQLDDETRDAIIDDLSWGK